MRALPVARGPLVAAIATLIVFGLWAGMDGGYEETAWYPAGVVLLVLVLVLWWAVPQRRFGRLSTILVAGALGYTAWAYASIAWAGDRGLALTGANRTLVYVIVLLLMLRQPWRATDAVWYAAAWAAVTVVVGYVTLIVTAHATDVENRFLAGRLIVPIDYANANAALFVLAAWPLLAIASARHAPWLGRAVALGLAGAAVEIALLAQSKGAAIGSAVTIVVLLVLCRGRIRTAAPMAAVAAVVALFHGPLFAVFRRLSDDDRPHAAISSAGRAIALSFVLLIAVGAAFAFVDRRLDALEPRRAKLLVRAASAVCALLVLGAAIGLIDRFGDPLGIARRTWHAFTHPSPAGQTSSHFLSTAGNHRYDFWRVAAKQFLSDPVLGGGADNFSATYVRLRRSDEEPLYPHSLEASLIGGNGLIGTAFFVAFAAAAAWAIVRLARSAKRGATLATGVLGMGCYWLAHGSVDWLWPFPALSGPVFALVGVAVAVGEASPAAAVLAVPVLARRLVAAAGACVAAVALVPAWLAARDVALGVDVWRHAPSEAYSRFASAASLNPVSDEPYLVAGTVAERTRDWQRVQVSFEDAVRRNPGNWYSHFELGVAFGELRNRAAARSELEAAERLDPREPLVHDVLSAVREDRRIPVEELDRQVLDRIDTR